MLQSHSKSCKRENGNTHFGSVFEGLDKSFCSESKKQNRIAFKTQTGQSPKTHSPTRWWSQFEVIKQVHDLFSDIPDFLDTADLPVVTRRKLIDICGQPQQQALLKIALAAKVDTMEPLVKATYNLEGDGPLGINMNRRQEIKWQ